MATRRQEKVARIVKEAVSNAITKHLNDPRIEGLISITKVEMAADLRSANVYISILGKDEATQNKTFSAITHAKSRIQSLLSGEMQSKFCPILHFYKDDKFKKTLETIKLIEKVAGDLNKKNLNKETTEY
jgi:ribosome-binding factor A